MKTPTFLKLYNSNFLLIFVSVLFFASLCLCAFELISIVKSPDDHLLNHSYDLSFIGFISLVLISGVLMMIIFFATALNLFRSYKESEKLNYLSNTRMKAIESSREGISILDEDGNFNYMNEANSSFYGYENKGELIGKSWRSLYPPKEQILFQSRIDSELKKIGWWAGHAVGRKKDGTEFAQEISLTKLDGGGIVCVLRDISQYIQKENTMQIIKIAIDSAMDGIFIIDHNNKFLFFNSSFLKIHNIDSVDKNKLINTDWRLNYSKKNQDFINSTILPKTILKGNWDGNIDIILKNDKNIYVDLSLTKLPNNLVLGVMRDSSEKNALEIEREKLKEQMYQSQKIETITRLIKGMGEDFKSSIHIIKNNIEKAFENEDIPEQRKLYMNNILSATKNADEKITQLLSLSFGKNVNAGIIDVIDLSLQVNNNMVREYQHKAKFSIVTKIDSAHIFSDPIQFQNCISGLCLNAIESFGNQDGVVSIFISDTFQDHIAFHSYLECEQNIQNLEIPKFFSNENNSFVFCGALNPNQKYIRISVNDNGVGMSPDMMPNIFDPFFSSKQDGSSLGIGLSSIKGMVLSAKGAIAIESVLGKGTSTHIFIPEVDGPVQNAKNMQIGNYLN